MKPTLSPRQLADAIGVSESSLKRWADEGLIRFSRTAGRHRRILLSEAIRYIRQSGLPIVNARALGVSELSQLNPEYIAHAGSADQPLIDAVMNGQAELARGLVLSMYLARRSVSEICDGPLTRAMHLVGELWKHDVNGIAIEHRATDICAQSLHQLRTMLPSPAQDAPLATGGAPSGDPYLLPSLMAATVLAAEGWREENLGPELPFEALAGAAGRYGAKLVWISFSVEQPAEDFTQSIAQLARTLQEQGVLLATGGRAHPPRNRIAADNITMLSSMSELAAFVRGLGAPRPSQKPPQDGRASTMS